MGNAIVTFKIMPEGQETDLNLVAQKAEEVAKSFNAKGDVKTIIKPLAFGLKELQLLAMYEMDEKFDSDAIIAKLNEVEGIQIAEMEKMDLAMG